MIIKVSKGYVSYKGELHGVGKTIELPDDTAKSLIVQGVVEEAGELPASDIEPIFADEEASEDIDEPEDDEETVAELPAVKPEQTVIKSTGKTKGTSKGKSGSRAKKV